MRSFRVGLIPVRLVAPLIVAAVAIPIVIDLLKPLGEKLVEEIEKLKPKPGDKPSEPETAVAPEAEATKAAPKTASPKKAAPKKATATKAASAAKPAAKKPPARKPAPRSKPKADPAPVADTPGNPEA